uniref:Uncharacterized protein LOC104219920 n=1 Tax=Nicotiana sylvestris TaxID=4096 RepID=A0A1U7VVL0_NICSY|nr:PREDICTED: uncharacterized protein LOC104219920 [Nicotiana sylvestris]
MLSYSGRVQLIKSILFGVQTYWAQIFLIPKKIMKMIETICRTFLWTGSSEFSKKTLIAWDRICQPKAAGGLNVINMKIWNKAAVLKYLWALAMKKDAMWIRWAYTYYIKNRHIKDIHTPKVAAWVVRKIIEAKDEVMKMRTDQHSIATILESFVKHGKFQIHKAYVQMQPQFIKVEWNMQADCIFCGKAEETFDHLYFGCHSTNKLWERILKWLGHTRLIGDWNHELIWISSMAKKKECKAKMITAAFAMVVYCIWRERNSMRFNMGRYIDEVCKEIAMHIHIQGRKKIKWRPGLDFVNKLP